jgi:hypothetical protein
MHGDMQTGEYYTKIGGKDAKGNEHYSGKQTVHRKKRFEYIPS